MDRGLSLCYSTAVRAALDGGRPVVALESTVITHGMDFPDNLEVARDMEDVIRAQGACPAIVGIVAGRPTVGMSSDDVERFARAPRDSIGKCSRRDLPVAIGLAQDGSLTVAGTMLIAHAAGIRLFATGGIGGVHRNHPFDVSADLLELGRTPVAVVCAGAKSILDLTLTLEVLETQGVPVIGFGVDNLPAFFCVDSGLRLPASVADIEELARVYAAWRDGALDNGMLITNPVPAAAAVPRDVAELAIARAVDEADAEGISGSAVTPFILQRVAELTDGRTLAANKALLVDNARVAAQLAVRAQPDD